MFARLIAILEETAGLLRFYSRLPLPDFGPRTHLPPDFRRAPRLMPLVGAILGAIGGLVAALALVLGLDPLVAGLLAVAALAISTGCFHEDGLADSADGLFGGASAERRLTIMRDSRIGAFGATALVLALMLRAAATGALLARFGPLAGFALVYSGALSRSIGLLPLLLIGPARADGLASAIPTPGMGALLPMAAQCLALAIALGLVLPVLPQALAGLVLAFLAVIGLARLARAKIGGYTGDILGAAQQIAELVLLIVLGTFPIFPA